ncbi:MAG: hypothetical protein SPE03_04845 [Treponema sp.]|nr:hypothetical protein [Treponema sp.]
MTDKEIIDTLNKLKHDFNLLPFENSKSIIDALEVAVEAIKNKKDSEKLNKNPFDRVNNNELYYLLDSDDIVTEIREANETFDDKQYGCSNYFNDKDFAKQVMLHQLLYRKLLKFKFERDNPITRDRYFYISKDKSLRVEISDFKNKNCNCVYFNSLATANLAIEDIVKPFLKEHFDFIWNL